MNRHLPTQLATSASKFTNMPDSYSIASKVCNYAHVLKNAGVGYGDYVEQITCLNFPNSTKELPPLAHSTIDVPCNLVNIRTYEQYIED